jgi:hypothetical protein
MEDPTDITAPLPHEMAAGEAVEPESLMEQLRLRRAEVADTKEVLLPIVGFEDFGLHVKHRLIDRIEVEDVGKRVAKQEKDRGERMMLILIDTIILSTEGFYVQRKLDREPVQLLDEKGGTNEPVTRWDQLALNLGWEPPLGNANARTALMFVFGGNEFAVGQHGIRLNRWLANTGLQVDEEFLGEGL